MGYDDGEHELTESGGACGTESTDVESSHRLSNPILDGKIWMLNKSVKDDVDIKFVF